VRVRDSVQKQQGTGRKEIVDRPVPKATGQCNHTLVVKVGRQPVELGGGHEADRDSGGGRAPADLVEGPRPAPVPGNENALGDTSGPQELDNRSPPGEQGLAGL
jgi:hypothetical protein